jgi:alkylhydroperoxidase family enzyme
MKMRTVAVSDVVSGKEAEVLKFQPQAGNGLTEREALAVCLAERISIDPHTINDAFFNSLRANFTEDEIVELVFACSLFILGSTFAITLRLDTVEETLEYANYAE